VQALSTQNKWNGYSTDYQGQNKLVFSLTDPKSCFASKSAIRISTEPKKKSNGSWDFVMKGSFVDKAFTLIDHHSRIIAQVCTSCLFCRSSEICFSVSWFLFRLGAGWCHYWYNIIPYQSGTVLLIFENKFKQRCSKR
jgi:LURP-one-related